MRLFYKVVAACCGHDSDVLRNSELPHGAAPQVMTSGMSSSLRRRTNRIWQSQGHGGAAGLPRTHLSPGTARVGPRPPRRDRLRTDLTPGQAQVQLGVRSEVLEGGPTPQLSHHRPTTLYDLSTTRARLSSFVPYPWWPTGTWDPANIRRFSPPSTATSPSSLPFQSQERRRRQAVISPLA
jgi:hypothetical protein